MPDENFEEMLRSIAREVGRSVERMAEKIDVDDVAHSFGVDPESAQEWVDTAAQWLRSQVENLGEDLAAHEPAPAPAPKQEPRPSRPDSDGDPLRGAGPHPLDLPTEEQGLALAALASGRWSVEPGTEALASHGEGPGPSDALGLVRELRARDWIAVDGALTPVGRHALKRWLDSAAGH
jgi:hypothetical protein